MNETNEAGAVPTIHSLLDTIDDDSVWEGIIERKESLDPDDSDVRLLREMLSDEQCLSIRAAVSRGTYRFSIPQKKLISKNRSGKKRAVYSYDKREMAVLKVVAYQMYAYDGLFSPSLYSFRRGVSAKDAVRRLFGTKGLDRMWGYKADIHDYFNSIDVDRLLPGLRADLADERLYFLFESILREPRAVHDGVVTEERKGVMAGVPLSAFLANYYLRDVDAYFDAQDCVYMRYADDILILAESREEVMRLRDRLIGMVEAKGLQMNPDKESFFEPGSQFEFLGFSVSKDRIDISAHTVRKMKGRIRRSARRIRRWMLEKNAPVRGTVRALIRDYNRRFYGRGSGELSWSAWYFPAITTTESLHEIDLYFQDWARYVATGRHNKKNYDAVPYGMLRSCGYRPLVSEYYMNRTRENLNPHGTQGEMQRCICGGAKHASRNGRAGGRCVFSPVASMNDPHALTLALVSFISSLERILPRAPPLHYVTITRVRHRAHGIGNAGYATCSVEETFRAE